MKRRAACIVCFLAVGALAASAVAQHGHDPLAHPRAEAESENQRVLLMLTGGDEALEAALAEALNDYRSLGKLVRYEYRLTGLPAESEAGVELRGKLEIGELSLPALAVLDTDDRVLGALAADEMVEAEGDRLALSPAKVRSFLEVHPCEPRHARRVLEAGLAEAKKTGRDVFVYLSAPW